MTKHENPALPPWADNETGPITLRDLFAAATLAGCSGASWIKAEDCAEWAYELADAMLAAREGGDDES